MYVFARTTHRSGSLLSLKKLSGSSAGGGNVSVPGFHRFFSVNIDEKISEFEFEFCLDSDGFIKNKDYKIPNYQVFLKVF